MNDNNNNNNTLIEKVENDENVHEIVILMANMLNYLNVSLYESLFTYNHEQAYTKLKAIYQIVSLKCSESPSLNESVDFYKNIIYLKNVTDTDDITYHAYMRQLKTYIQKLT
jgi:uncharacterized protein YfkK (UPF0435 family)